MSRYWNQRGCVSLPLQVDNALSTLHDALYIQEVLLSYIRLFLVQ